MISGYLAYDVVACILFAFILVSVLYKKLYKGLENRYFLSLVLLCFITTVMDMTMELLGRNVPMSQVQYFFACLSTYIYYILRQLNTVAYVVFIFIASGTYYRLRERKVYVSLLVPFIFQCVFILSNLFTNGIFTISVQTGYQRGPQAAVLYITTFIYGLIGIMYLFNMRKFLGAARWLAMLSMYLFIFLSALFQLFHPGQLVEMICMALSLLLIHLIVQWSKEFWVDAGLYSFSDYRVQAKRLAGVKRRSTIVILRFDNAREVRTTYGETRYNTFILETTDRIKKILDKKFRDYRIYYHTSGALHIMFGYGRIDIEKDCPELISMWTENMRDGYTARMKPLMCSLDYPTAEFSEEEDLIAFGFMFPRYMERDEIFFRGERAVSNRGFELYRKLPVILSRGIEENRFEMYYQPIYDLKERRYCSAEALIRLDDPEFGNISPGVFIPAAERRNLILPIGSFVLESVFRFAARPDFEQLGLKYVELNLSVEQLLQDNLVDEIRTLQKKYELSSMRINLEITESAAGLRSSVGIRNIIDLTERNYTFSLDDYGIGYSNIQRAVELPLSIIKIDKSIIDTLGTRKGDSMVSNTIRMMHEIGFKVVAEGVEKEMQSRLLEAFDCDYIQGFYYAKPMCEKEFIAFLEKHNTAAKHDSETKQSNAIKHSNIAKHGNETKHSNETAQNSVTKQNSAAEQGKAPKRAEIRSAG